MNHLPCYHIYVKGNVIKLVHYQEVSAPVATIIVVSTTKVVVVVVVVVMVAIAI